MQSLFLKLIPCFCRQKNDFPEVSRGLNLVKTQAYVKKQAFDAYADRPDSIANSYHALAVAMHETMCVHEKLLLQSNTVNDTEGSSDSTKRAGIVDEIRNNILAVKSIFSSFESSAMPSLKARSCQQNTVELRNFEVKSGGMLLTNMMPSINSEHPWIITKNEANNEDYSTFVEVTFPQSESLARLIVQGGNLPKKLPKNIDSIFTALPCGLRVEDCDGAIDKTVLALADIFSWENITKNNSPETVSLNPNYLLQFQQYVPSHELCIFSSLFQVFEKAPGPISFRCHYCCGCGYQ
jgi:hypothetical protein